MSAVIKFRFALVGLAVVLVLGIGVFVWVGDSGKAHKVDGEIARHIENVKRINPQQYRNIIRDVFGPAIEISGRFVENEKREDGLLAIGAARVSVSSVGFEASEKMAREIASQVVNERNRVELVPCKPVSENQFDAQCGERFIGNVGRLLYRRALLDSELDIQMRLAADAAMQNSSFYAGLERSLANMLLSPNFLLRVENAEPDPDEDGKYRLTGYSKATRLSFLLWNSAPDNTLLAAAENGDLHTRKGLQRQVNRMLGMAQLEQGVRAFFIDMLAFDKFDTLSKDKQIYPRFTHQVIADAKEQTLRTLVDHLLVHNGDYRDVFTSPKTFLTPSLAALLRIPMVQANTYGAPDEWVEWAFADGDPRAGLLAQPSFVALHSHNGRTSPTNRGKALRENLLCQEVPPPPGDVDFNIVEDNTNPNFKTMRQRLIAHAVMPTCAGCHKITDPIGLALETFDSDGSYRTTENGVPIDTRGEIDGVTYADAAGLGQALRDNPNTVSCLVNRVYAYGIGRETVAEDRKWLKGLRKEFAKQGYQLRDLLRQIATSEIFYRGVIGEEANAEISAIDISDHSVPLAAN